ncbi:CerR family C-terminal domain-containing protein [Nitratidesulfovibrio liaohensis]|uniref:CerR family C-terminal domain-containing protein n=1 Tax=Nitratidesulfovibrio liaohensis TaxID=2604158 RepID=A0ABY9QY35_9BACT|nr:CerR family C-terminal domain-containing protein [Nitratidesulfovibrio liaohensis]WMW64451.1 CerR family C-terminal domain-containing protein [Nitratidesulfovibrio liaohensis]
MNMKKSSDPKASQRGSREQGRESTRQRLLEAAGIAFAEHGYDRATGKEICERAGANPAAINYHFGGKDKLYAAALHEAHRRFLTAEDIRAALPPGTPPAERVGIIIRDLLSNLLTTDPSAWQLKLMTQEMMRPTPFLDELVRAEIVPKSMFLRGAVAELLGRPDSHPAVQLSCMNIISMCLTQYLNREIFRRVFPDLILSADGLELLTAHTLSFVTGGLRQVAATLPGAPLPQEKP